jgi:HrpA-like RNA helicase
MAEVARIDLASAMLETMSLGIDDFARFPWLDPPDATRMGEATKTLATLGAIDPAAPSKGLTEIGRAMARVPAHPRLARALVEGARLGCAGRVARIAAALSDRDPCEGVPPLALLALLERDDPRSDALVREARGGVGLVGHGVGKSLHESPEVPNYGRRGDGAKLKEGMVIAIEPMINLGKRQISVDKDGWTIRTQDRKPSAHFEHTVGVSKEEPLVLTTFSYIEEVIKSSTILLNI